jgi:hypothetical protein
MLAGREVSSPDALERGRELVVEFLVNGMLSDSAMEKA